MNIRRPIFIVGSGRSGTTLVHDILAVNEWVCWFSDTTNNFYYFPWLAFLERILKFPIIGDKIKKAVINENAWSILTPSEGEDIYQKYCGFGIDKLLTEKDKTKIMAARLRSVIKGHLVATGAKRFLNKSPSNTQRVRLLNSIFPNAYFIHVIRDGRAVSNSLQNVPWWKDIGLWWAAGLKPQDMQKKGFDAAELSAIHWQHNVNEIRKHRKTLKGRYMEVHYEDFIRDVPSAVRKICQFCGLGFSESYKEMLPASFPSMDFKWKKAFTKRQQTLINKAVGKTLKSLGYTI